MDLATVGERIKILRKQQGITQRRLGEMSGITYSYLCLLEKNKTGINITSLLKLASALNTLPTYFLTDIPICDECKKQLTFGHKINNKKELWYCAKCNKHYILYLYHTRLMKVDGD